MRLVVAMTGASGAAFGVRLVERLHELPDVEVHLVVSRWACETLLETGGCSLPQLTALADAVYDNDSLKAPISSGSFKYDGMAVVPCSMKTLAATANGLADNLITRVADVCIKEHRKLVLAVRETPLSAIHLENMLKLARLGVTIMPPVPALYHRHCTIESVIDGFVGRIMDQFGIENSLYRPWTGEII